MTPESVPLLVIGLFRFPIFFWIQSWSFLEIYTFVLGYLICWHIHKFLMVLWICVVTAVMLPFVFLILHIEASLIFFLV